MKKPSTLQKASSITSGIDISLWRTVGWEPLPGERRLVVARGLALAIPIVLKCILWIFDLGAKLRGLLAKQQVELYTRPAKAPFPFGRLESDLGHLGMRKHKWPLSFDFYSMASIAKSNLIYKSSKELQYGCRSKSSNRAQGLQYSLFSRG